VKDLSEQTVGDLLQHGYGDLVFLYFQVRVALVESQVPAVCARGEVEDVEQIHVLGVVGLQKDHVVGLEVVQLQFSDSLAHVLIQLLFEGCLYFELQLLAESVGVVDGPKLPVVVMFDPLL
jgi:hypothetical protein